MNTLPELVAMTDLVVKGVIIYLVVMIVIALATCFVGDTSGK